MSLRDFKQIQILGKGSYGNVYRATRISDGQIYAIKEVAINTLNDAERYYYSYLFLFRSDAVNEIRFLASNPHPYIVAYYDAFLENDKLYIVMEYAKHGDLHQFIRKAFAKKKMIEENTVWSYFIQLTLALHELHGKRILHRDIKAKNVFLPSYSRVALGDMGCSKHLKTDLTRTQVGTPYYMSPELMKKQPYDNKSDIWALGVLLYEMMALHPPFMANDMDGLSKRICQAIVPPIPKHYSPSLGEIVKLLLKKNPADRPNTEAILNIPAVQEHMHLVPEPNAKAHTPTLLSTIKVPRRVSRKTALKLPKASYPVKNLFSDTPTPLDTKLPSVSMNEADKENRVPSVVPALAVDKKVVPHRPSAPPSARSRSAYSNNRH